MRILGDLGGGGGERGEQGGKKRTNHYRSRAGGVDYSTNIIPKTVNVENEVPIITLTQPEKKKQTISAMMAFQNRKRV